MDVKLVLVLLPLVAVLAVFVGYMSHKLSVTRSLGDAETRAKRIVGDAQRVVEQARVDAESKLREAESRVRAADLEAKEMALKMRGELEQETRTRQKEIQDVERRVLQQEEQLARRLDQLDRRESDLQTRDRALGERDKVVSASEARLSSALEEQRRKLEGIAGLTAEEAKRQLMAQVEVESRREAQLLGMKLEEEARETAQAKAKEVLATTIQRLAPDYTVETAVSIVDLPSDDMKGRIIGREGRNIRALELHTGVDLIVDDTPEAVLISAYDPYRREIARLALQKLIADGRIHPARIEEVVEKVKKDMEEHLKEEGDKACFEVGVHGLHPELVKLVGRMKYRTSYGQNCLQHSKEVAWLAGMMAAEIKADVKLAKRMGLLHDIGKALTHEQEGSHPELSLQVLTKYGESPQIINAALCGHENVEPETIEAVLTEAADGISAARPGARRDVLESYIKRLAKLEEIAMSYKGVEMCYAIQAGRELRIMTKAEQISDLDAHQLAKDISKRIEAEMQYPGHIKVIVIRETRAVEVAK
ncbi:MAG TPA: ribonuclease Y [Methylomirabilota bacterium]|jgi:ribonuclease Y|nr:ribonuclease Y [Methylomirabilota bacterium]